MGCYGFSPYTTVTVTIKGVSDVTNALSTIKRMFEDIGYSESTVADPSPTRLGFRSETLKGVFVIVEFDSEKNELEMYFSQYAERLTDDAEQQLKAVSKKLKLLFNN